MKHIPNHLNARVSSRSQHRQQRLKVIAIGIRFDQVPPHAISHRCNAHIVQALVISFAMGIVFGSSDKVEPWSGGPAVTGTFKARKEEALESALVFHHCRL